MAITERPGIVDRVVERMFYPNWGGKMPGPLAGQGERVNKMKRHPLEPDEGYAYLVTQREVRHLKTAGIVALALFAALPLIKTPNH